MVVFNMFIYTVATYFYCKWYCSLYLFFWRYSKWMGSYFFLFLFISNLEYRSRVGFYQTMSDRGSIRRHTLPGRSSPANSSINAGRRGSQLGGIPGLNLSRLSNFGGKSPPLKPTPIDGEEAREHSGMGTRTKSSIIRKHLGKLEDQQHITAVIRIRPLLPHEDNKHHHVQPCIRVEDSKATVTDGTGRDREAFLFDDCFNCSAGEPDESDQAAVYEATGRAAVENALGGFNSCVFAYGQTNSGKTYTMLGGEGDEAGIMPRVIDHLFQTIDAQMGAAPLKSETSPDKKLSASFNSIASSLANGASSTGGSQPTGKPPAKVFYEVNCSFMEIYMENVRDLLLGSEDFRELKIRNHPLTGPYVEGLTVVPASSPNQLSKLIARGSRERTTATTIHNERSSRSHAVFQVTLTQTETFEGKGTPVVHTTTSRINLVDLAGSERLGNSFGPSSHVDETSSINLSLSTLRRVVDTLIDNSKHGKKNLPPYRESKLTWLLSESLGGNSKTIMIGTVSPHPDAIEESLNTLRYTLKAKGIVNTVSRNEEKHLALIRALRDEIATLQNRVSENELHGDLVSHFSGFSLGTPRDIEETMDSEELKRQLHLRNKIIEDLHMGRSSGGVGPTKEIGIQAVEEVISSCINISLVVDQSVMKCELKRGEILQVFQDSTGVPADGFVDLIMESEGPNRTRISAVGTAPSATVVHKHKREALVRSGIGLNPLEFTVDINNVSLSNFNNEITPVMALSPRGLQAQLLSEQHTHAELNKKVRYLRGSVDKLRKVESNQSSTLEKLTCEVQELCGIIREKNEENLHLSSQVDSLTFKNSHIERQMEELRESRLEAERTKRAVSVAAEHSEQENGSFRGRLLSLTEMLNDKVRSNTEITNELLAAKSELKQLRRESAGNHEFGSAAETKENNEKQAETILNLARDRSEFEIRFQSEKEARMRLGEERRKLSVDFDQLQREHVRLRELVDQRGLVLVGSGSSQSLMRVPPANRYKSKSTSQLPARSGSARSSRSLSFRSQSETLPRPSTPPPPSKDRYQSDYSPSIVQHPFMVCFIYFTVGIGLLIQ